MKLREERVRFLRRYNGLHNELERRGDPNKVRAWLPLCPTLKNFHAACPEFRTGGD